MIAEMFQVQNFSRFTTRNLLIWCVLAFQAGTINTGGFLACHRFVTHTTGFATMFGTDFAQGEWLSAFGMLSVPLFFLAGAMFSAFFVDRRMMKNLFPRYSLIMGTLTGLGAFVVVLGVSGSFGVFGEPLTLSRDYALLALLGLMSGLQNAVITSASGSVVRTTHLTGITTDLGIGLVRLLSQTHDQSRETEVHAARMRIGIITSFAFGSAVAASIFLQRQYWGFLIPTAISFLLWILTFRKQVPA